MLCVLGHLVLSNSATPWTAAARLLCPWGFSRKEYWSGLPCPPPRDLPNPGIEPTSQALQADSLLSEPPGKLKNTEVSCLSLLQVVFLTQESNWGLLHHRQILHQLSYQGSPILHVVNHICFIYTLFFLTQILAAYTSH